MSGVKITDDNYNTVSINEFEIDIVNEGGNNKDITYSNWGGIYFSGSFNNVIRLSGTTFGIWAVFILNGSVNEFSMGTKGDGTVIIAGFNQNNELLYLTVPIRIGNNNQNSTLKEILSIAKDKDDNKKNNKQIPNSDARKIDLVNLIPKSEYYRYDMVNDNGDSIKSIIFDIKDSLIVSRSQYEQILSKHNKFNEKRTVIEKNTNGYTPLVKNKIGTKDVAMKDSLFTCVPVECDGEICKDAEGNPFYDQEAAKSDAPKESSAIIDFLGDNQSTVKEYLLMFLSIILCVLFGFLLYKLTYKLIMTLSTGRTDAGLKINQSNI